MEHVYDVNNIQYTHIFYLFIFKTCLRTNNELVIHTYTKNQHTRGKNTSHTYTKNQHTRGKNN